MSDLIDRQKAIDAINEYMKRLRIHIATPNDTESYSYARGLLVGVINDIKQLPPIQPDKDKVSDLLYRIYSIESPHLDMSGVIAKKYYCKELWKELFGKESEIPVWMN